MPSTSRSIRHVTALSASIALGLVAACSDEPKSESASVQLLANAEEMTVLPGPGGISLAIPPGASDVDLTITMTTQPRSRRAQAAGTVAGTPITLEPDGAKFGAQLELSMPIVPASIPAGKSLDDAVVMSAPAGTTAYVPLPTRREGEAVVATTDHFSDFVVVFPPTPVDPPEALCPIPTTSWSNGSVMSYVRSLVIHDGRLFALTDDNASTAELHGLPIASGLAQGAPTIVEAIATGTISGYARLQVARFAGAPTLFVSTLARRYDDGSTVTDYPGGIARVGRLDAALPANVMLVPTVADSVDGVFADIGGPRVVRWSTVDATGASYGRYTSDAGGDRVVDTATFGALPILYERFLPIYSGARLLGLVRGNEDGTLLDQSWSGWPVAGDQVLSRIDGPGRIVMLAVHDSQPVIFTFDSTGLVRRYGLDASNGLTARTVAQLPSTITMIEASGQARFTNGSLLFPAMVDGSVSVIRVKVATGAIDRWNIAQYAISALDARDGVVCVADSSLAIRCGCLDGSFEPLP